MRMHAARLALSRPLSAGLPCLRKGLIFANFVLPVHLVRADVDEAPTENSMVLRDTAPLGGPELGAYWRRGMWARAASRRTWVPMMLFSEKMMLFPNELST